MVKYLACLIILVIITCQNADPINESIWAAPNQVVGLWKCIKIEKAQKGNDIIESQTIIQSQLEFDSISVDSFYHFYYPTDTSCYFLNRIPFNYTTGVFRTDNDTGTALQKNDTLRIRWTNEISSDPDMILYYIKYVGALPRPFC